jgi:hypothetical protein
MFSYCVRNCFIYKLIWITVCLFMEAAKCFKSKASQEYKCLLDSQGK